MIGENKPMHKELCLTAWLDIKPETWTEPYPDTQQ